MTSSTRWQRVSLMTAIVVLVLAFATMWLYPLAVLFWQAGRARGGSTGDMSDLTWSTLAAATSSACATLVGGLAALGARTIPRRHAAILDAVAFVPILFPPFVIGMAVRSGIGRAGFWPVATAGNFSGFWPMVLTWAVAYLPLAYGASRVTLQRVGPSSVDTARVSGLNGSRLVGLIIAPLRAVSPVVFLLVFVLVLADPVVPNLVGGKTPQHGRETVVTCDGFRCRRPGRPDGTGAHDPCAGMRGSGGGHGATIPAVAGGPERR